MKSRRILLVLFAVAIAGGTFQLAQMFLRPAPQALVVEKVATVPQDLPKLTRVIVAAQDLRAGTLVQPEQLAWREIPDAELDPSHLRDGEHSLSSFAGAVVRARVPAGAPVLEGRLVKPGERGFLAAVLDPDMRAVSVPINGITGIAGLIFPGDRVDVIMTHTVVRPADPNMPERRASETVLTDVRVLALDQRVSNQDNKPVTAQIATLEVSPAQAETLALVMEIGRLSLSLRGLAVAGDPAKALAVDIAARPAGPGNASFTWDSDVSAVLPNPQTTRTVNIIRGGAVEAVVHGRSR